MIFYLRLAGQGTNAGFRNDAPSYAPDAAGSCLELMPSKRPGSWKLMLWGWVAYDERQKEEGHRFWYNAYWKTELAK